MRYHAAYSYSRSGHHHFANDVVYFYMNNREKRVRCGVTRLSFELLEPDLPPTRQGRIQAFKQRRAASSALLVPNLIEDTTAKAIDVDIPHRYSPALTR